MRAPSKGDFLFLFVDLYIWFLYISSFFQKANYTGIIAYSILKVKFFFKKFYPVVRLYDAPTLVGARLRIAKLYYRVTHASKADFSFLRLHTNVSTKSLRAELK
jgi:hypothetical protein